MVVGAFPLPRFIKDPAHKINGVSSTYTAAGLAILISGCWMAPPCCMLACMLACMPLLFSPDRMREAVVDIMGDCA